MTTLDKEVIKLNLNFAQIPHIKVEIFHWMSEEFILLVVALQKNSGDHKLCL